jgi:hypothetical protein
MTFLVCATSTYAEHFATSSGTLSLRRGRQGLCPIKIAGVVCEVDLPSYFLRVRKSQHQFHAVAHN